MNGKENLDLGLYCLVKRSDCMLQKVFTKRHSFKNSSVVFWYTLSATMYLLFFSLAR